MSTNKFKHICCQIRLIINLLSLSDSQCRSKQLKEFRRDKFFPKHYVNPTVGCPQETIHASDDPILVLFEKRPEG
jgi:hypothetical protein